MAVTSHLFAVQAVFSGKDDMSAAVTSVNHAVNALASEFGQAMMMVRAYNEVANFAAKVSRMVFSTIYSGISVFADFEEQLLFTGKVMELSYKRTRQFGEVILGISTRVPVAVSNLNKLGSTLAIMGIRNLPTFNRYMDTTAKVMLTTGLTAEQAGLMMGKLRAAFGEGFDKNLERVSSAFVIASNIFAAKAKEIAEASQRVAGVARQFGLEAQEVFAMVGILLESTGVKSMRVGSSISRLLSRMMKDTEKFARVANINIGDFNVAMKAAQEGSERGSTVILGWLKAMQIAYGKRPKEMQKALTELIGNQDVLRNATIQLIRRVDDLSVAEAKIRKAYVEKRALQDALNLQMQGMNARIMTMTNRWLQFKIRMVDAIKGAINPFLDRFGKVLDALNTMPKIVWQIGIVFTIATSALMLFAAKVLVLGLAFKHWGGALAAWLSGMKSIGFVMIQPFVFLKNLAGAIVGVFLDVMTSALGSSRALLGAVVTAGKFFMIIALIKVVVSWWDELRAKMHGGMNILRRAWEFFRASFTDAWIAMKSAFLIAIDAFNKALGEHKSSILALVKGIALLFGGLIVASLYVLAALAKVVAFLIRTFTPVISTVVNLMASVFTVWMGIVDIIRGFFTAFTYGWDTATELFIEGTKKIGLGIWRFIISPLVIFLKVLANGILSFLGLFSDKFAKVREQVNYALTEIAKHPIAGGEATIKVFTKGTREEVAASERASKVYSPRAMSKFQEGGIVTRPTIFGGTVAMAEAGPEAIIPLKAISDVNRPLTEAIEELIDVLREAVAGGGEGAPIVIKLDSSTVKEMFHRAGESERLRLGHPLKFGFHGVG